MLGKLLRYELQGSARNILPLFSASLLFSLLIGLYGWVFGLDSSWISGLLIIIEVILIIALGVMTMVITIRRFYTNLLGSEGYLMFTLPVSTHQLILSKLLASILWYAAAFLVICLSLFIMISEGNTAKVLTTAWQSIRDALFSYRMSPFFTVLTFALSGLVSTADAILAIYLAMALGQLANEHRFMASFASFFGVYIVRIILTTVFIRLVQFFPSSVWLWWRNWLASSGITGNLNTALLAAAFVSALTGLIYYTLTHWLLKHKLNMT